MSYPTYDLTINKIFDMSVSRAEKWHPGGIEEWSALEWAGAMAGEAGEAANFAKKLKRIETNMKNIKAEAQSQLTLEDARANVAIEVADTILYGVLVMARVGIKNPEKILRDVFNKKSEEYGFPERL
jgi:hypothetical protein